MSGYDDMLRIDWIQQVLSLHQMIDILYVVDGYELRISFTDGRDDREYIGSTLRLVLDFAMEDYFNGGWGDN